MGDDKHAGSGADESVRDARGLRLRAAEPTSSRNARRQAIVAAARRLGEQSGPDFSIEVVAARAGVSRRTVYNHFATAEDLLVAVCEDVLGQVVGKLLDSIDLLVAQAPALQPRGRTALDALCAGLVEADLLSAVATMALLTGEVGQRRTPGVSQAALDRVGSRVLQHVEDHAPEVDPFVARLTIAFLMAGVGVISDRWRVEFAGAVTEASSRAWDRLMRQLVDHARSGYLAIVDPASTRPAPAL